MEGGLARRHPAWRPLFLPFCTFNRNQGTAIHLAEERHFDHTTFSWSRPSHTARLEVSKDTSALKRFWRRLPDPHLLELQYGARRTQRVAIRRGKQDTRPKLCHLIPFAAYESDGKHHRAECGCNLARLSAPPRGGCHRRRGRARGTGTSWLSSSCPKLAAKRRCSVSKVSADRISEWAGASESRPANPTNYEMDGPEPAQCFVRVIADKPLKETSAQRARRAVRGREPLRVDEEVSVRPRNEIGASCEP